MQRGQDQPLQGARVLIVEDEFFIADDLVRALRSGGATPVGPANSIEQAEQLIDRNEFDAVILDLNLRGEMAFSLVQRLSNQLPFIVISGYGDRNLPDSMKTVTRLEKPISMSRAMACLSDEIERFRETPRPS